jgi:hypothetical protein
MGVSTGLAALFVADYATLVADQSATLVVGGVTISGTSSPISRSDDVQDPGVFQLYDTSFLAPVASYTGGVPEPRTVCTLDGVGYYVDSALSDGVIVDLRLKRIVEEDD